MSESWQQHLAIYDNEEGERVIYATAYGDNERKHQVMNCVRRYGRHANVRTVLACYVPPAP